MIKNIKYFEYKYLSFFKNKINEKITTTENKTATKIKPNELEFFLLYEVKL